MYGGVLNKMRHIAFTFGVLLIIFPCFNTAENGKKTEKVIGSRFAIKKFPPSS